MIERTKQAVSFRERSGRLFRAYQRAANLTGSCPQMSDITPELDHDTACAYAAEIITRAMMELFIARLTEGCEASDEEVRSRLSFFSRSIESIRPGLSSPALQLFYQHHEGKPLLQSPDSGE